MSEQKLRELIIELREPLEATEIDDFKRGYMRGQNDAADSLEAVLTPPGTAACEYDRRPRAATPAPTDDALYAAYANHCAIQGKPLMTAISWRKAGRPKEPAAADRTAPPLRMIDGKFGITDGGKLIKASSGEEIPEWEPLHIFRARDRLSLPLLYRYREICVADGCNDYHLKMVDAQIERFQKFEQEHPEWMKQPGITQGKAFTPTVYPCWPEKAIPRRVAEQKGK